MVSLFLADFNEIAASADGTYQRRGSGRCHNSLSGELNIRFTIPFIQLPFYCPCWTEYIGNRIIYTYTTIVCSKVFWNYLVGGEGGGGKVGLGHDTPTTLLDLGMMTRQVSTFVPFLNYSCLNDMSLIFQDSVNHACNWSSYY